MYVLYTMLLSVVDMWPIVAVQVYIKRRGRLSASVWKFCVWSFVNCQ